MNISVYQQLQSQLQTLGADLTALQQQPGALVRQGQQLLGFWQSHLGSLSGEDLPASQIGLWRSLHTELYRGIRLLNTDLMFLQGSRTPNTQAEKQRQIQRRLDQLAQYCSELIKLGDRPTPEA
ncbi:hypothetical protein FLX56_18025 [Synechococcus moorigangaii CMS01]|nr:hypothetical protein [Synechococcus moorigangaii CMS01]